MSIYKPKGIDVWYVNISHPNHPRVRRSTGTNDRQEALRIHDEIKADLWKRPVLKGHTWGAAVLLWCERETRSQSELYSLAKLARVYPDRVIEEATKESFETALKFCKTAGTYTRYRTMIQAILNLAKSEKWITEVPKLVVRIDKKKKPRTWLTPEQWTKLYLELPAHQRAPADFAIQTGLRQNNVLGLTWDRVDLTRRVVWVEAEDTKGDEAIAVPLNDRAFQILELRSKDKESETYVFTYQGERLHDIKTGFQPACVRAGVGSYDEDGYYQGFTWHGLRHTWATWHIQNETPLDVLQKLGGWADLRMVMNYAHHSPGHLARYANNNLKKET